MARATELGWDIGKTVAVLKAFWGAVKAKLPQSWEHWSGDKCEEDEEDHVNSVLTTTTGMYSLNGILAKSLPLVDVAKAPTSPEAFKALLNRSEVEQYFTDGDEGFWANQEEGTAAHGTSRKAFKAITDDIWEDLKEE